MTYTYQCAACSAEWEAEQRIVDPPLRECPRCSSPDGARRMISGTPGFWERDRPRHAAPRIRGRT